MDNYGNANDFVIYCEARGYEIDGIVSPSPSEDIDRGLLVASEYIDGKYRAAFPGSKTGGRSQVREWPRTGAADQDGNELPDDEVPVEIINATYEATYRQIKTPGSLTPDYVASERIQSERVGSLAVTYATSIVMSADDTYPVILTIDMILAPLLGSTSNGSRLFGQSTRI